MSTSTERKAMREVLASWSLMTPQELAGFLSVSEDRVHRLLDAGKIPSVDRGTGSRRSLAVDPIDAAVFVLAGQEGMTSEEFWGRHGEAAVDRARKYIERVRKMVA